MILRRLACILGAALFGLLAPTNLARANLITNGGFETGDFSGWTQGGNLGFTSVVTSPVHSGNFAAQLGPVGSLGSLSQTLATEPGQAYDVNSLFLRSDGLTPNQFQAFWNGNLIFDRTPFDETFVNLSTPTGFVNLGQLNEFQNLLATGPTTQFQLNFRNDPGFFQLDDVVIDPVPEPATLLLFGTTMAGLGLARWRRRRQS